MMAAVALVLVLQPVLHEPADLRLVAAGLGASEVQWSLDGAVAGTSHDHEAVVVHAGPGLHRIEAASDATGAWTAMARPLGNGTGMTFTPAWSAHSNGVPALRRMPAWNGPDGTAWMALALVAAAASARRGPSKGP